MNPNSQLTIILTHDGEFVSYGFIAGLEMVEGDLGWYPSLILITTHGERLDGWKYMVRPYTPHLQIEHKPFRLEYHDASTYD
jgi:hypothetical protein